jgi:hypothetical protein
MRSLLMRLVMAVSLLVSVPLVSACAIEQQATTAVSAANTAVVSATGYTPAQNLYRAHGLYNIALTAFTTYAESTFASPGVVSAGTKINRGVKPAFEYAEAVLACAGPDDSGSLVIKVANERCKYIDISPQAIAKNESILTNGIV